MMNKTQFMKRLSTQLQCQSQKTMENATVYEMHAALSAVIMEMTAPCWNRCRNSSSRKAFYFSAEFLLGRAVFSNLFNLGMLDNVEKWMEGTGFSLRDFEDIEDAALGNGGLGRLAACFLDSAATHSIPLHGYGIRYKYGLFKQRFEDGFQIEDSDDWTKHGDPWSIRCESESVTVDFSDFSVTAVPYDIPIIGYKSDTVNTLRLWQAESPEGFDFSAFNEGKYTTAMKQSIQAANISNTLYPNDSMKKGKKLRLRQQYFFCSASLQDIVRQYTALHGSDFSRFAASYAVQLNDTHPVVSICELIRIFTEIYSMPFEEAFIISQQVFSYTNHTVMAEALEKWDKSLIKQVLPSVYSIAKSIQKKLEKELYKNIGTETRKKLAIVDSDYVHMANLGVYATHCTNGVAALHTNILKKSVFKDWYSLYPDRFQNKTNGITQRRFLGLANPQLSAFITELLESEEWMKDLSLLENLAPFSSDEQILTRLASIKQQRKQILAQAIEKQENITVNPNFVFDIQIKRLHEYKRQLLNAFSILDIYYGLKEKTLEDFTPTVFLFGAKAAPGYFRAKAIIKYINEIARMIAEDPDVSQQMQVVFLSNYNVSYAEKLVTAADISEQISTAGTEASGTGNMKFMLNATVTLGTYDGANVEIVEEAGFNNNYIFGTRVEELERIRETYSPKKLYKNNPRIKRVVDSLMDGTFDDGGTGMFKDLYDSLLKGASWHDPDNYYLLHDFEAYVSAKLQTIHDYKDTIRFTQKGFLNMAHAGKFSSDRTVQEYAKEIWKL